MTPGDDFAAAAAACACSCASWNLACKVLEGQHKNNNNYKFSYISHLDIVHLVCPQNFAQALLSISLWITVIPRRNYKQRL